MIDSVSPVHKIRRSQLAFHRTVADKINVYVGDADSYFLNMGVHLLENFLKQATNPRWTGEIMYQPMAPHCWGPSLNELLPKMAAQVERHAAPGAVRGWRY